MIRNVIYTYFLMIMAIFFGGWMTYILTVTYVPHMPKYDKKVTIPDFELSVAIALAATSTLWGIVQIWMHKGDALGIFAWGFSGLVDLCLCIGHVALTVYMYRVFDIFTGLVIGQVSQKIPIIGGAVTWFLAMGLAVTLCSNP